MSIHQKKSESDWLLDDPLGFDLLESEPEHIEESTLLLPDQVELMDDELATEIETAESSHPYVVTTEATLELHGPRQLILDTETTGFISGWRPDY